jgi:hypothetical protein
MQSSQLYKYKALPTMCNKYVDAVGIALCIVSDFFPYFGQRRASFSIKPPSEEVEEERSNHQQFKLEERIG